MDQYPAKRFYILFISSSVLTLVGIALIISSFFVHANSLPYIGLVMLVISVSISIFANRAIKMAIDAEYKNTTKKVDAQFKSLRDKLNGKNSDQNTASTSDKQ